jgi:hypothetical protein
MSRKVNNDRIMVLASAPRARCVRTGDGYEVRNFGGDDCYERGYTVLSDGSFETRAEAWHSAAESCAPASGDEPSAHSEKK